MPNPSPSLLHTQSLRADNKDQGLQPGWMRIWGVGGSPPKTTNRQKFPALLRHVSIGALQQIVNNLISCASHAAWTIGHQELWLRMREICLKRTPPPSAGDRYPPSPKSSLLLPDPLLSHPHTGWYFFECFHNLNCAVNLCRDVSQLSFFEVLRFESSGLWIQEFDPQNTFYEELWRASAFILVWSSLEQPLRIMSLPWPKTIPPSTKVRFPGFP